MWCYLLALQCSTHSKVTSPNKKYGLNGNQISFKSLGRFFGCALEVGFGLYIPKNVSFTYQYFTKLILKQQVEYSNGLTHTMTALHRFGHLFTDMHCVWPTRSTRDWIQDCLPAWQPNPLIHVGGFDVGMLTLSLSAFFWHFNIQRICSSFFFPNQLTSYRIMKCWNPTPY